LQWQVCKELKIDFIPILSGSQQCHVTLTQLNHIFALTEKRKTKIKKLL